VTTFFGIKVAFFCVFLKRQDGSAPIFFQDLGENTCSLQLHWKVLHPAFKRFTTFSN